MTGRRLLFFLFVLVFLLVVILFGHTAHAPQKTVTNFEQCAQAGYKIQQGYPRVCTTTNKTYTEELVPGR